MARDTPVPLKNPDGFFIVRLGPGISFLAEMAGAGVKCPACVGQTPTRAGQLPSVR